ncbi:fibronectin type III domain-containing protein [Thalassobius sp. I31.1]|uniref:fibronectin type III domain-containing protein n=1 Tax=Thalassobius sp. I31.1 TaxID=2109912 RepID=UPI000D1B9E12|nr:fibronectin type III domain-containing protein [Thalassobius sp. I31.1]
MPQALAFVFPVFKFGGALSLFTAAGGLTLGGSLVSIAGGLALNAVASKLFAPDIPSIGPESIKVNAVGTTQPRLKHYGRVRMGYAYVLTLAKEGKLYRIIVHGQGQFAEIEGFYLDKGLVALAADGFVQNGQYTTDELVGIIGDANSGTRRRSYVRLLSRSGLVPSTHYPEISAAFPEWSEDHRLDGLATSLLIAEAPALDKFNAMFPNREPVLEVVAKTSLVEDPRTGIRAYSDNLALCALDWEQSPDGGGLAGLVDVPSYARAADVCDQGVPVVGGGVEPRYRFAGTYDLNEEPLNVRKRFLGACAGENYVTPEGKLGLRVGEWYEPRFTIRTKHVLSYALEVGSDAVRSYNVSAFEYVDPKLNFTQIAGDPWRDEERISAQGEITSQPFISAPSHRQCRAVTKIMMERDNPRSELVLKCKPSALPGLYEPVVAVDVPEYGLKGIYRVKKRPVDPRTLTITYHLSEIQRSSFTQTLAEQGTAPSYRHISGSEGIPVPTGFNAAPMAVQIDNVSFAAGIGVAWNAPPYESLSPKLEYRLAGNGEWQNVSLSSGATTALLPGLSEGQGYDVRLAWITAGEAVGAFVSEEMVVAGAQNTAPAVPAGLSVADLGGGTAEVSFTASVSAGLWKSEILRNEVLVGEVITEAGAQVTLNDDAGAGDHSWTVRAANVAAERSPESTPVNLTLI